MRRAYTFVLLSLFASLSLSHNAFAGGPWLWKQHHGFAQLQANIQAYPYTASLMSTFRDTRELGRGVFGVDIGLSTELGITDRFNVMVSLPFKYVSTGATNDKSSFSTSLPAGHLFGPGNLMLGLKYGVLDTNVKLAVSFQAHLNTIARDRDKGLATGYDANTFRFNAHIGGSILPNLYMFFEAGYGIMTDNYSHIATARLELGYNFWGPLSLIVAIDARLSLRNGSRDDSKLEQTALFPDQQEWIIGQVKFAYEHRSGWGASLGTGLIPIYFQNVGFSGAFDISIFKRW